MEHTCETCANAIFCPTWGEYKCLVFLRRNVYEPGKRNNCDKYVKKTDTKEPVCRCDDCESQLPEDMA